MVAKKPRIVIIGAGMAGLAAANKLHTAPGSAELFDLSIVEGGNRIGGRIRTSQFGGDRIEMGATWIHGIGGSPIYNIATQIGSLHSDQPWERMDGFPDDHLTVAEGGFQVDPTIVDPISSLYRQLMDFAKGKKLADDGDESEDGCRIAGKAAKLCVSNGCRGLSIGSFLRRGLEAYWVLKGDRKSIQDLGNWSRRSLEEAIFAMHENTERTYTSAGDLSQLDFEAEKEYREFPDEEITIAKGYTSIIESLASVLPLGLIQLGRKVEKIEWHPEGFQPSDEEGSRPVKLHFDDGSVMAADHVIVTVSLGVLKAGIRKEKPGMFNPLLPSFKTDAITRLGFGVVNKLFLELDTEGKNFKELPFLQMVFEQNPSVKQGKVPWWMRKTVSLCPIYKNSNVLLSWFAGHEALELESLKDNEIIKGVSATLCHLLPDSITPQRGLNSHYCNGNLNGVAKFERSYGKFTKVLKSGWGNDPLFLGSYSFVAVGSSGEDLDLMAEPLPEGPTDSAPPLQLLFAGEATHRTHYSTTHGAYFSGIREATRLLQHYSSFGFP
ncbi:probable polyamine oxidase 5 [Magnolia sinica]|uniref:probable polyamine oxidase 5 n=1 Tax=Magnolia sinica TaxID=86752 RepID=UPI00265B1529|nr:probable polyamine oxidase 5 [Magnolia sinica]